MSNLPRQVKAQVAEANRLQSEAVQAETPAPEVAAQPSSEPSVDAAATPSVSPPAPTPIPTPVPAAPAAPDLKTELAAWQHKYSSLQGKLAAVDRERVAAKTEAAEHSRTIENLRQTVAQLQELLKAQTAPVQKRVSDAETQEYTPEMLDVVGRKAMETLEPTLRQYQQVIQQQAQQIRDLQQGVSSVATATATTNAGAFMRELSGLVPDWNALNFDPGFVDWLSSLNPSTGQSFKDAFDSACERLDASRAAWFFNAYKSTREPDPAPAPSVPPLSDYASPSTQGGSAPAPTGRTEGRMWTQAQITGFYRDKALGKFMANPQAAAKLEQDIFKAQQEGRVTA